MPVVVVIKVGLFAKLLDITTRRWDLRRCMTERHPGRVFDADLREGMVHVLQVHKVDHGVAWPRPCFCNAKIRDVIKRISIRMTGTGMGRSSLRCGL